MLVPDGWAAARVGAALGVPAVATAHRADVLDVPARGPRSRARVAEAVEAIDQVCAVSAAIGDAAAALAPPRRPVEVVPNGADAGPSCPGPPSEARARLGLPDDGPIVSYVGKLVPRKGVDTLVEAMGLLGRRPGGAPLLVAAGIGEERPALERRAAELGVADRVRFVGKVAHDEVGWWMAAGDLFVLPSLSEGLPTVICEAMNVGRAVVATAVERHARDRPRRAHRPARAALRPGGPGRGPGARAGRARPGGAHGRGGAAGRARGVHLGGQRPQDDRDLRVAAR